MFVFVLFGDEGGLIKGRFIQKFFLKRRTYSKIHSERGDLLRKSLWKGAYSKRSLIGIFNKIWVNKQSVIKKLQNTTKFGKFVKRDKLQVRIQKLTLKGALFEKDSYSKWGLIWEERINPNITVSKSCGYCFKKLFSLFSVGAWRWSGRYVRLRSRRWLCESKFYYMI